MNLTTKSCLAWITDIIWEVFNFWLKYCQRRDGKVKTPRKMDKTVSLYFIHFVSLHFLWHEVIYFLNCSLNINWLFSLILMTLMLMTGVSYFGQYYFRSRNLIIVLELDNYLSFYILEILQTRNINHYENHYTGARFECLYIWK